jgi:hypothetical protein
MGCAVFSAALQFSATSMAAPSPSAGTSVVSVRDAFGPLACGQPTGTLRAPNSPREPVVAVDPADPNHVVATYIVDSDLSNMIRASRDGGLTWQTVPVPGISACTGGANQAAADPSLAFSSDGSTLYLATLTTPTVAPVGTDTVIVSTSHDGGFTWSPAPTTLSAPDGLFGDRNNVTTDPTHPGTAYITFERHDSLQYTSSTLYFRRTDDAGRTWSAPVAVYSPAADGFSTGNAQVLRTGNGALVDVFDQIIACNLNPCLDDKVFEDNIVYAAVSTDEGRHWAPPVKIGNRTAGPGTHAGAFCGDLWATIQATTSPAGVVYVSFPAAAPTASTPLATDLVVAKSADGLSWVTAGTLHAPTVLGLPTLAVANDGTLGMSYYQPEATACAAAGTVDATDLWLARSRNDGRSWTSSMVAGPFDATGNCFLPRTPAEGCLIADYDGLQPMGDHGFAAVFEVPHDRGAYESDIRFAHLPSR